MHISGTLFRGVLQLSTISTGIRKRYKRDGADEESVEEMESNFETNNDILNPDIDVATTRKNDNAEPNIVIQQSRQANSITVTAFDDAKITPQNTIKVHSETENKEEMTLTVKKSQGIDPQTKTKAYIPILNNLNNHFLKNFID